MISAEATPGTHVMLLPRYRHLYSDMGEDMFVIEQHLKDGDAKTNWVNTPVEAVGVQGGAVRMRHIRTGTHVHAPIAWLITHASASRVASEFISAEPPVTPEPLSVTAFDSNVMAIAKEIAARDERIEMVVAERSGREIKRLTDECIKRNSTINALHAELERERSNNFVTLRGLISEGGVFLTAKEVAFLTEFLDGVGKIHAKGFETFSENPDEQDALWEKCLRLKLTVPESRPRRS